MCLFKTASGIIFGTLVFQLDPIRFVGILTDSIWFVIRILNFLSIRFDSWNAWFDPIRYSKNRDSCHLYYKSNNTSFYYLSTMCYIVDKICKKGDKSETPFPPNPVPRPPSPPPKPALKPCTYDDHCSKDEYCSPRYGYLTLLLFKITPLRLYI